MSGTKLCPPARTLASSPRWRSTPSASPSEAGRTYSKGAGFMPRRAANRSSCRGVQQIAHRAEELVGHHLGDAAEHPLADPGDETAHLHVGRVRHPGAALDVAQADEGTAPDEAGRATALHSQTVGLGRVLVREL